MNFDEWNASLAGTEPPSGLSELLVALWHDGRGDWDRAHRIVQNHTSRDAAAVHAYLHRKEGDCSNADYWYSRAQRKRPDMTLAAEWAALSGELLAQNSQ